MDVYRFIREDFNRYDKKYYMPEQVFTEQAESAIENYPQIVNIKMNGFDSAEKERLLAKWKY